MKSTLYTIGYEKRTIDEFVELLLEAGVHLLVDVRETAWSHKPGFSKTALTVALGSAGIEYRHAPFAGNPKALREATGDHAACLAAYASLLRRRPSIVERFEELLAPYMREGAGVAIMCFERHPGDCHRAILAEAWRRRGRRRVAHLAPEGCVRMVAE